MQFRFTFFNAEFAPAGLVVAQPVGWKDAALILERHEDYSSLVEYFEAELIWYGSAMNFLRNCEDSQGPDALIRLLIEVSFKYGFWETLFDGRVDQSMMEENSKSSKRYKMKVPIIRNDLWTKFINRKSIPVDVLSTLDLDGGVRTVQDKFVLPLPSQTIRTNLEARIKNSFLELANIFGYFKYVDEAHTSTTFIGSGSNIAIGNLIQIGFNETALDEVEEFFEIESAILENSVAGILIAKFDGAYNVQARIEASIYSCLFGNNGAGTAGTRLYTTEDNYAPCDSFFELYIQKNDEPPIIFSSVNTSIVLQKQATIYSISQAFTLLKGDKIKIYALCIDDSWGAPAPPVGYNWTRQIVNVIFWGNTNLIFPTRPVIPFLNPAGPPTFDDAFYDGIAEWVPPEFDAEQAPSEVIDPTELDVSADTDYEDTQTDSLFIKDVASNILSKLIGIDAVLTSDFLDTCKGRYTLQKFLHLRGYNMVDKPFFLSFDEWWEIVNPILCLGLGQEGNNIVIEGKEYFYNPSPSINFSNVSNIIRTWDKDKFYKSIKHGYQKWSSESASGIDDPQTASVRRTILSAIGKDFDQLSKGVAASLAIEQSRRNRVEQKKDFRFDEEVAIIAVKQDNEYDWVPEVGADFLSVSNLLNSATRYNVRLTPARNFDRWKKIYNGCMQHALSEKFYFTKGEGNYDATSEVDDQDCDYGANAALAENQDIDVTSEHLISTKKYQFKHPLTWANYKTIRDNKNNAIGLSPVATGHGSYFIEKLKYFIVKGYGEFDVNLGPNAEQGFIQLETGFNIEQETGDFIKVE